MNNRARQIALTDSDVFQAYRQAVQWARQVQVG